MHPIVINNVIQTEITEHYLNNFHLTEDRALNILHINIQSLRDKLDSLEISITQLTRKYNKIIHIIALSEIWIYPNENFLYQLENYTAYFSNRMRNRSGGCCIFVHNSIESDITYEDEYEFSNFLIVRLIKENLNIACIYRYGQSNTNNFVHYIETNILKFNKMIAVGDINNV